jgi:hypothetical protein
MTGFYMMERTQVETRVLSTTATRIAQTGSAGRSHRMHRRTSAVSRAVCALLILAATCCSLLAQTHEQGTLINREYAIKAAFLYHFLTYIEWPQDTFADSTDPFVIGIFQDDPFDAALEQISASKSVRGRQIVVKTFHLMEDVSTCHILFVPRTVSSTAQRAILASTQNSTVFVVGESDGFVEQGGHAQFFLEGNKVRFAFNISVTEDQKHKISSKLLSLDKSAPRQ